MAKNALSVFGILAILLMGFGMVSAENSTTFTIGDISAPASIAEDAGSFTFTFNLTYTFTSDDMNFSFGDSSSTIGTVSISNETGLNGSIDESRIVTGTVTGFADQGGNSLTVYINATSRTGQVDDETNFTVSITDVTTPDEYDFCEIAGTAGDLEFADITFTNLGEGEDEDWYLLDEIEIEVEVENTHSSENIKDVIVEIMILDDNDNDVTNDFDFADETIDLNTIKDGDAEIATFTINELPADLESGNYKVYLKAYSEDDEDTQCVAESSKLDKDFYQRIDVIREDDPAVIVRTDLKMSASCGDNNVQLPLSVYNLGSDKEEKVLVTLENSALGISEKIVIENLRSGKRKEITFFFDLPAQLSKEYYSLDIMTYYDYDDDEDELDEFAYSENSDDDLDKSFSTRLEILSCKAPEPTVSAGLESEAVIGTDLVVKALITNNGNDDDFVISVSGYESWAELVSITPQTASINKGEFETVMITLTPTATGTQSFKVNTIINGDTYDQTVSVNIAEEPGFFDGISNKILYTVAGIVAICILIAALIIARVRRPARPQF